MPDRSAVPSQTRAPAPEAPESLLVCPECEAAVAPRLFESHLRRVHHVYQFRGERRSLRDTLDALLDALLVGRPDPDAWRTLTEIAQDLQAIDALGAQLEENLRMSCPRCPAELRRPQMIQHLWDEHRLVLDGRRVREPWAVIEDWLDDCRSRPDPELLWRCRVVAQKTDG